MLRHTVAAVAMIATLAIAPPLAAQVFALNPTTMIGYAGTTAGNAYRQRDFGPQLSKARSAPRAPKAAAAPAPAASAARAAFRPDPAVREQVHARAVAAMAKTSPDDAAKLRTLLAGGEMRGQVVSYLKRYGMSPDNLVDATALYLSSAWFASRANSGDPTPAQMRGLRTQVAQAFAGMPQLVGADNAVKQELAEASIVQAMLSSSLANAAAADPKLAPAVRTASIAGVRESYQLDLSSLELTDQGLR